jgi:hypothetical protein
VAGAERGRRRGVEAELSGPRGVRPLPSARPARDRGGEFGDFGAAAARWVWCPGARARAAAGGGG